MQVRWTIVGAEETIHRIRGPKGGMVMVLEELQRGAMVGGQVDTRWTCGYMPPMGR